MMLQNLKIYMRRMSTHANAMANLSTKATKHLSLKREEPLTFTQQHIVDVDNEGDGCEVYFIRNFQVIEGNRLEDMAQELIGFVQHIFGFRIRQVVIDFIKNTKGLFVLTDIKNFTYDEHEKVRYLRHRSQDPQTRSQEQRMLREKAAVTATCSLCKAGHQRRQVQNTITKKMLYKLNAHLSKRGIFLLKSLAKFQHQ